MIKIEKWIEVDEEEGTDEKKKMYACGGKLVNGICQECGLDNRKSDSRYQTRNGTPALGNETNERGKVQIPKRKDWEENRVTEGKIFYDCPGRKENFREKGQRYLRG